MYLLTAICNPKNDVQQIGFIRIYKNITSYHEPRVKLNEGRLRDTLPIGLDSGKMVGCDPECLVKSSCHAVNPKGGTFIQRSSACEG